MAAISASATLIALGYSFFVEAALNVEAFVRRRRADQLDDDLVADQRLAAPVLRGEGKEAMLDTIPLACAGWVVGNRDG